MKNGQKLKLRDATPVSPQEIFKRYKCQSLGMPKASPSSSIKSSDLSRHFIFIVSCTVVLFLERLSFFFFFVFVLVFFFFFCFFFFCKKNWLCPPFLVVFFKIS